MQIQIRIRIRNPADAVFRCTTQEHHAINNKKQKLIIYWGSLYEGDRNASKHSVSGAREQFIYIGTGYLTDLKDNFNFNY